MSEADLKYCGDCKKDRSVHEFCKNSGRKDKLQSLCKKCQNVRNKKRYHMNREYFSSMHMLNKRKRALMNYTKIITEYFSEPCIDCGVVYHPSCMVFDHIDPKLKKRFAKRGNQGVFKLVRDGYSWKLILKEIDKCEVRCQNCHHIKTSKDFEYWSEISRYIDDMYTILKLMYKKRNFSKDSLFNRRKRELISKYHGFMKDKIAAVTQERRSVVNKKKERS